MTDHLEKYFTLEKSSQGGYKEKGSKFLAFAFPVKNEDEIRDRISELKKKFYDAHHHCYAYILGNDSERSRANDDGEPAHSAGDPILNQLRSRNLTNSLVVVVRYFGGAKLGVGGLTNAYKLTTEEALNNNGIKSVPITRSYRLHYRYQSTNEVMRMVKEFGAGILGQQYDEECTIEFLVNIVNALALEEKINLLKNTGHKLRLEEYQKQ